MSASAEKINQLFWLAYAQAIKDEAKANFGSSGAFFVGSEIQKSPVAGDTIPNEYTYQGLFDVANNLLSSDNLFYNPSAQHGYAQALSNFLDWVDLEAKPDPNASIALLKALEAQQSIQTKYQTEQDRAYAQFTKDQSRGLTMGMDFYAYIASGRTPGYKAAETELAQIASKIQQIQAQINGPKARQINQDRALIAKGFDQLADFDGYNMRGAVGNLASPDELLNAFNKGEKVAPPSFHRLPSYNAPRLKAFVQEAQQRYGTQYEPEGKIQFKIDTGRETSSYDFGQTTGRASVGFKYGWLAFNVDADHSTTSTAIETGSSASSVEVTMTFDKVEAITVNPGLWNIDVSQYKLRSDAPPHIKTLVRVSQLIVASRVGYVIKVDESLANTLDTKFRETTNVNGSFSILGIRIPLGGSGSDTKERNTHEASFDRASKTLTVLPKDDAGVATLLGLVGEKFDIKTA